MKNSISLLFDLSEFDYEIIRDEMIKEKDGLVYHYFIDFYDISNYCFPFGLKTNESNLSIDYISDSQFALYQFFKTNKKKVYLANEYLLELVNFKKFISEMIHLKVSNLNALEKLEYEFYNLGFFNKMNTDEVLAFIEDKLGLFLAYMINQDNTGLERLTDLFKSMIIICEYDTNNLSLEVKQLFKNLEINLDLNNKIFGEIWESDKVKSNRKPNRESALNRDVGVISKLFTINNLCAGSKNVFSMLSTTNPGYDFFLLHYKKSFSGHKITDFPIRNQAHLFLKSLCWDKDDLKISLDKLEYLQKHILELKPYLSNLPQDILKMEVQRHVNKVSNYYRERFENSLILSQYKTYSEIITRQLRKIKEEKTSINVATVVSKIIELSKEHDNMSRNINKFEDFTINIKFDFYLKELLVYFKKENNLELKYNTGRDYVRGTVQHLPILFRFNSKNLSDTLSIIDEYIVTPKFSYYNFQLAIENFGNSIYGKLYPSLEERLIKAIILLLVPKNISLNNEDTNTIVFEWLSNLISYDIDNEINSKDINIKSDFIYLYGWVARRATKYEESIEIFKNGLREFKNDGRFYHGICLAYYCLSCDSELKISKKSFFLEKAIINAKNALEHFEADLFNRVLYLRTKESILNTLSYLYTDLFNINNDFLLLKESRKCLELLKQTSEEDKSNYIEFPEYLHTEAYLELHEFLQMNSNLQKENEREAIEDTRIKINQAYIAIDKALNESYDKSMCSSLYKEITSKRKEFYKTYPIV